MADSVRLFCDRARSAKNDFEATGHTLGSVGVLCRRLDGIPLAIELAAARAASLAPGRPRGAPRSAIQAVGPGEPGVVGTSPDVAQHHRLVLRPARRHRTRRIAMPVGVRRRWRPRRRRSGAGERRARRVRRRRRRQPTRRQVARGRRRRRRRPAALPHAGIHPPVRPGTARSERQCEDRARPTRRLLRRRSPRLRRRSCAAATRSSGRSAWRARPTTSASCSIGRSRPAPRTWRCASSHRSRSPAPRSATRPWTGPRPPSRSPEPATAPSSPRSRPWAMWSATLRGDFERAETFADPDRGGPDRAWGAQRRPRAGVAPHWRSSGVTSTWPAGAPRSGSRWRGRPTSPSRSPTRSSCSAPRHTWRGRCRPRLRRFEEAVRIARDAAIPSALVDRARRA